MPSRSKKTLCKMSLEKLQAQLPICALYEKANMIFLFILVFYSSKTNKLIKFRDILAFFGNLTGLRFPFVLNVNEEGIKVPRNSIISSIYHFMAPRYAHSIACRLGKFGFLKKKPKKDTMNDKTKLQGLLQR